MGNPFYYSRLYSDQAKQFYIGIIKQITEGKEESRMPLLNTEKACQDVDQAVSAVMLDHPEFFFLNKEYHMLLKNTGTMLFRWKWLYPEEQCRDMQRHLNKLLVRLTRPSEHYLNDWERELNLYERIAKEKQYVDSGAFEDHTIVNPLLQGRGVCDGYAKLFAAAARRLKIPAIVICGHGHKENHLWNAVQIRKRVYHVDVTWENVCDGHCAFDYFNLNDMEISADHASFLRISPSFDSGGFHRHNGCYYESMSKFIRQTAWKMLKGDPVIHARLSWNAGKIAPSTLINIGPYSYYSQVNEGQNTLMLVREL